MPNQGHFDGYLCYKKLIRPETKLTIIEPTTMIIAIIAINLVRRSIFDFFPIT